MRGAERALLAAVLATACQRGASDDGPVSAPEALAEFSRCALNELPADAPPARIEAALRLALRRERGDFVVRGGRCEDALRVRGEVPTCLAPLRGRWAELLPVAQRPGVDAIDLDVAVRRVGEAWSLARRCR